MHLIVKSVWRRGQVKQTRERRGIHADRQKRRTEKAPHSQQRAGDRSGHPLAGTMGWVGSAMGYYRLLGDVSTPISTNYPPYSVHRIHWYSYTDSYVPGCWVLIVVGSRIPRSTYFSFTCSSTSLYILAGPSLAGGATPLVRVRFLSRCQPRSSAGTRYRDSLRDAAGTSSLLRPILPPSRNKERWVECNRNGVLSEY